jgi:hypothetical protein
VGDGDYEVYIIFVIGNDGTSLSVAFVAVAECGLKLRKSTPYGCITLAG